MRFAHPWWLAGTAVALVVGMMLVLGGFLVLSARRRFGDEDRVRSLVTGRTGSRRAFKGVLLVLALCLGFLAAAQPQYGRGTRLVPATNLDLVIALDFSKSMYARDVTPSRIARAQAEVGKLIADLPGARFGAVAFAGEPLSFPLTSDGAAIAQFFRQLSPNVMPVGGTAIARALEAARELLLRDPLSARHRRVIVLVTDGEDLEGDPVSVAQSAAAGQMTIHVVQIGGRTPEPIPEVNEAGEVVGWRKDQNGQPLTTSLSAEGEATLTRIAEATGGMVVRAAHGSTGIRQVGEALRRMMTEELSEKVETVYADIFYYPLGLAILLLLLETLVGEVPARPRPLVIPLVPTGRASPRKKARPGRMSRPAVGLSMLGVLCSAWKLTGCERVERVFTRHSPVVDRAVAELDGGDAAAAADLLSEYLATGKCESGKIGTPSTLRTRPNASFDLGLALFQLAEKFGRRFGEEPVVQDGGRTPEEQALFARRSEEVTCALSILRMVTSDPSQPVDLLARAHYLAGNLEFLRQEYRSAIAEYDQALRLIPGIEGDAGDSIGRDVAHNRALALRRLEEQERDRDAGQDGAQADAEDSGADGGDAGRDAGEDSAPTGPDSGDQTPDSVSGRDSGADGSGGPDAGAGSQHDQSDGSAPAPEPQPESGGQDERVLDLLEQAPTLQEHEARQRAQKRRMRTGMEDK